MRPSEASSTFPPPVVSPSSEGARSAVASAFLSRRAMVLARETVARAHAAVQRAASMSRVLADRSAGLRRQAEGIRAEAARTREAVSSLTQWSREIGESVRAAEAAASVVELDSAIPADHPVKQAIEDVVREVMGSQPGVWRVWITLPGDAGWWGIRIRGLGFDWVGTPQDETEQTPEFVRARLEPVVRAAGAEATLRRRGHRQRSGSAE